MKKFRVLIFAGAVLVLRQTSTVEAGFVACVKSASYPPDPITCSDSGCCNNQTAPSTDLAYEDDSPGNVALYINDPGSCGGVIQGYKPDICADASCGSTNVTYITSSSNDSRCCPSTGSPCVNGVCCGSDTCINGTCMACVSNVGKGCPCGGVYQCDGSCPGECLYDSDCASGSHCANGCCASGSGGCANPNAGDTCATDGNGNACGTQQCDGSCDTSNCSSGTGGGGTCNTDICGNGCGTWQSNGMCDTSNCNTSCSCYSGIACGSCGTYDCGDICNDPCSGDGGGDPCAGYQCAEGASCVNDWGTPECFWNADPILIDLSGGGFLMTDARHGVNFDFFRSGTPLRLSWTQAGARNGWLALDLNHDGKIDNGQELFGNAMASPGPAGVRLGFKALAVYDTGRYGGNGDGVIDAKDAIYARLRIWVDKNHNGVSDPGELTTLQQAGIKSISLDYQDGHYTDAYGNQFQYRAQVVWAHPKENGKQHWAYDVILVSPDLPLTKSKGGK